MTITMTTPSSDATSASVADVMKTINTTLREAGGEYSDYSCKSVSWDDVTRGEVGGALSCWGGNITDTRLYEKSGKQLYTVRSENFNEKLGAVSADELALITGNQTPGGGTLKPITLADFLKGVGTHGAYAGLDAKTDLSAKATDAKVCLSTDWRRQAQLKRQVIAALKRLDIEVISNNDVKNINEGGEDQGPCFLAKPRGCVVWVACRTRSVLPLAESS